MMKIMIGVVIAAVVVIVTFMMIDPNSPTNQVGTVVEVSEDTNSFRCTIEGDVLKTGTYTLQDGATMDDLIEKAGGLNATADERAFFETAEVVNGGSYYIPSKFDDSDICNNSEIEKVNINVDDADTLQKVNGITTSVATSIVSYRVENGQFNFLEDLLNVYGIGNATYRKIRAYVILHD